MTTIILGIAILLQGIGISRLVKRIERLEDKANKQLTIIARETNCDDTHEYVERLLKDETGSGLPYRINAD